MHAMHMDSTSMIVEWVMIQSGSNWLVTKTIPVPFLDNKVILIRRFSI